MDAKKEKESSNAGPDAPARPPSQTDQVVEQWFQDHFMGLGPRLDVEMYNVAHRAKEDLKRILNSR